MAEQIIAVALCAIVIVALVVVIIMQQRAIATERAEHRADIAEFSLRLMSRNAGEYAFAQHKLDEPGYSRPEREYSEPLVGM